MTRFSHLLASSCVILGLTVEVLQGQVAQKQWKDQAEQELFATMLKEPDTNKKLVLLYNWRDKYPDTEFKQERALTFLAVHIALDQTASAELAAQDLLTRDPLSGAFFVTVLVPAIKSPSAKILELVTNSAAALLLQTTFVAKRPDNMGEDAWNASKIELQRHAYNALGWASLHKKDHQAAEKAWAKSLELNPAQADVSFLLAIAVYEQQKPERYAEVVYHLARAASYEGTGALPAETRKVADGILLNAFSSVPQGTTELTRIRSIARLNPFPPADFRIKSAEPMEQPSQAGSVTTAGLQSGNQGSRGRKRRKEPPVSRAEEDFDTAFNRNMSPAREFLTNFMRAHTMKNNFVPVREQAFQNWLAQQYLELERLNRPR